MIWLRLFIHRLCGLFLKRKMERDLEDEIRSHLDMQIEDNLRLGMSPEEARYEALRKFGGVEQIKESYRDRSSLSAMESTLQDLRYALRMLRRSPGFTAVAVLTLGLGIGANTAIFSVIDAVLLKRLPVKHPEQLVLLSHANTRQAIAAFPYKDYKRLRDHNQVFSDLLAYRTLRLTVSIDNQPEPAVAGQLVTGKYYSALGVNAALGRTILPDDDRPGEQPVCVISYNYWQQRFARDPAIVGKIIHLSGLPFTIIGVTPPEFFGLEVGSSLDISVPLMVWAQAMSGGRVTIVDDRNNSSLFTVLGRLRPRLTMSHAQADLGLLYQQIVAERAASNPRGKDGSQARFEERLMCESGSQGISELRWQFSRTLLTLMSVVALTLLIACANVAGLLLARAVARRREIAIRLALGVGRLRLVRQLFTESVLLGSLGGLLGLLFALWGTRLLLPLLSQGEIPVHLNLSPDVRALIFTVVVSALTSLTFGLAPALVATRVDLNSTLKNDAPELSGRGHLTFGQVFVIAQVALSLLLLVGAGLFVRSLQNLQRAETGFAYENVLVLKLEPAGSNNKTPRLGLFYDELLQRVEALPGVRQASLVGYSPMARREWLVQGQSPVSSLNPMSLQGYAPRPGEEMVIPWMQVYPDSFGTLGIPLVAGRDFSQQDNQQAPQVAIINESMARRFYGRESPLGRRFGFGGPERSGEIEIIGMVKDVKYTSPRNEGGAMFYLPFAQANTGRGQMTLIVRTAGDPLTIAAAVRRETQALDPQMPRFEIETLTAQIAASLGQERLLATLSSGFGLLALLLGCLGLYGILSYTVAQRTREIGIRMAIGADRRDMLRLVLRDALRLALLGVAIGIPATLAAARLLANQLFGISAADPGVIGLATLILLAVAVAAGYLPARRAARVDPLVALRYE
jgi:predicted permease